MNNKETVWPSQAGWIWLKESKNNQYVDFRCEFAYPEEQTATLLISADSRYAVYVNGQYVPGFQYADFPTYKVYDQLDITPFVQKGANTLAVLGYYQGESSLIYRHGEAGVLFAVIGSKSGVLAVSDHRVQCRESQDYTSGEIEKITNQLSFSFRYDATAYDGWREPGYSEKNGWVSAVESKREGELVARPVLPLVWEERRPSRLLTRGVFRDKLPATAPCGERMQEAYLSFRARGSDILPVESGVLIEENKDDDGVYLVFDLGGEESGVLELEMDFPEPADLLIGYGEHLDDLRVRTAVGGRQFCAVYRAKEGRQRFFHPFKRFGCRYVALQVYSHRFRLFYAGIRPTSYPFRKKSMILPEDSLHRRIAKTCVRTLTLCAHEHYEDCPWREQALYAMDSRNQMLFGYTCFENLELPRAALKLLALGQRDNGLLELCAPAQISVTIPAFSLVYVTALKEYVQYTDDGALAEELMPTVERIFEYFENCRNRKGLIPVLKGEEIWNFYEWSDGLDDAFFAQENRLSRQFDAPLNAFYTIALQDAAYLWRHLGNFEKAAMLARRAEDFKTLLAEFWNPENGFYATYLGEQGRFHYAQLTQYLMICAGAVPPEQEYLLLRETERNSQLIPVTLSCMLYRLEAVRRHPERFRDRIKREIEDQWGGMLFKGATSFWETIEGADAFDFAGSLCHGWSAVPIYFYENFFGGDSL